MRIRAHAARAARRQMRDVRFQTAVFIEQLFRPVTSHPVLEQLKMPGFRTGVQWHLVRSKRSLHLLAIDGFGSGPALGRFEHDHRPAWACRVAMLASLVPYGANLFDRGIEGPRHVFMHERRLVAGDEQRRPAVTTQQLFEFLARNAG